MTEQNVVVYISNRSHQCEKLKAQLDEWQVDYEEKNISYHKEYVKELHDKRVYGTPAVFVGEYKILGFPKRKLKQILGIESDYSLYSENGLYFER